MIAAVLMGAFLGTAPTPSVRTVVVLPISSDSKQSSTRLQPRLEEGLRHPLAELVVGPSVDAAISGDMGCRSARCLDRLRESVPAQLMLRTTVSHDDAVWRVSLELVSVVDGTAIARANDTCEICGIEEVGELLRDRAATLIGQLERLDARPPGLSIATTPPGARVWVDGRDVGFSPVQEAVSAGNHIIEVELPGYVRRRREVEARVGVDTVVELSLSVDPSSRRRARRQAWGGATLGVGAAIAGGGVGLLVVDGREYRRDCRADAVGNCRDLYETTAGGATLLAVGTAAIVAGITLLVTSRRRSGRDTAGAWELQWRF